MDSGSRARSRVAVDSLVEERTSSAVPNERGTRDEYSTSRRSKIGFLSVGSGTNARSFYCALLPDLPCGNSVGTLRTGSEADTLLNLQWQLSSFLFDYVLRLRLVGLNLNYFVVEECPAHRGRGRQALTDLVANLSLSSKLSSPERIATQPNPTARSLRWSLAEAERTRVKAILDAIAIAHAGLDTGDAAHLLAECDLPKGRSSGSNPKGLWRIEKDKEPELRQTVLTLVALQDMDGSSDTLLPGYYDEGWILPETLRLADYGLGQDDRAQQSQLVACPLGPRFIDWQLAQGSKEAWQECHLHARNLLGDQEYAQLASPAQSGPNTVGTEPSDTETPPDVQHTSDGQVDLFE